VNKRKYMISLIFISFLLLVGTLIFSLLRDDDPYRYFTGVGNSYDLSPDNQKFLFSYYINGKESVYESRVDGKDVKKLTGATTERHHNPRYSTDGMKILFLSKNSEGINTLYIANQDGSEQKRLTPDKTHISEAVFSSTDEVIYYIGTPAEDFKKAEGETTEGFDLFQIEVNSGKTTQLTDQDYFSMNNLSISQDGKEIYYSLFDGNREKVTAFSLEEGKEIGAPGSDQLPNESYSIRYSPDGSKIAYTTVSEESQNSSLFEYELFLYNVNNNQTERLTNLKASVLSPRFFKNANQIAFLHNTNWPTEPAEHELKIVDMETEKIQEIELSIPHQKTNHWLMKSMDTFANASTVAVFYVVFIGLLSTYLYFYHSKRKSYLPAIISLSLSVLIFVSSFVVSYITDNPWNGIALGMLAAAAFGCTFIVFLYTFILNFFGKRNKPTLE
jgi:dipeptidyl aminopeptidase/acylaminoacyl peptidase